MNNMDEKMLRRFLFVFLICFLFSKEAYLAVSSDLSEQITQSSHIGSQGENRYLHLGPLKGKRKPMVAQHDGIGVSKQSVDNSAIEDVTGKFIPSARLTVRYGSREVKNGDRLNPLGLVISPYVEFSVLGQSSGRNLFTLVMVDPDAPDPLHPIFAEVLHWLVVNIPERADATKGQVVAAYMGPNPVGGEHRYIFVLFKQRGPIGNPGPQLTTRVHFNTRQFAARIGLGLPVAALYFNSSYAIRQT